MIALMTRLDAVFDGLSFGIKYLVRSFDLKVEPGGRKGFVTPCIAYYRREVLKYEFLVEKIVYSC